MAAKYSTSKYLLCGPGTYRSNNHSGRTPHLLTTYGEARNHLFFLIVFPLPADPVAFAN